MRVITTDIDTLESAARILNGQRTGLRSGKPGGSQRQRTACLGAWAFTKAALEVLREAERQMTALEAGQAALTPLGLPEN